MSMYKFIFVKKNQKLAYESHKSIMTSSVFNEDI